MSSNRYPPEDGGDGEQGMKGFLQLLIAGRNGPVLLEPVDGPLDHVAVAGRRTVEADAARWLVAQARNHRADPTPAEIAADLPAGIALVASHAVRSNPGATEPPCHRSLCQQGLDLGRLLPLSRRQRPADRFAASFRAQMELGAEAALAPAEGLIGPPFFAPAAWGWARIVVPSRK